MDKINTEFKVESDSTFSSLNNPAEKPKPCCACPETRQARDDCIVSIKGDPLISCHTLIEAHRQ
ncbi:hypothetical protein PCANB_000100 [Pneumocystis canis]|nr:hypothetical protein PCANB_000100 [Pneumocystis canis]